MILIETPANPLPNKDVCASIDDFFCKTRDGVILRVALFRPQKPEIGTVVLAQGRAEWIEKYFPTISDLLARGFAVVAFDWRGQGGSARLTKNRRKGHIFDFADYIRDLDSILTTLAKRLAEKKAPPLSEPLYGLGHSMGALIMLLYSARRPNLFTRLILCAPMFRIAGLRLERAGYVFAKLASRLGFGKAYVPGNIGGRGASKNFAFHHRPFTGRVLTSDRAEYDRIRTTTDVAPRLALGAPTLGWVSAADKAMASIEQFAFKSRLKTPILFLIGGSDVVVDNFAIEHFARGLKNCHVIKIAGSSHDILCEKPNFRAQFWEALDAFFVEKTDAKTNASDNNAPPASAA